MPTLYAQSSGNLSAINWNTAANGSGTNATPGAADTLVTNTFTVNIDGDYTFTKLTNTSGGTFTIANGITLTCTDATNGILSNSTLPAVTVNFSTASDSATINSIIKGGQYAGTLYSLLFSGLGTLHINGTCTGGAYSRSSTDGNDAIRVTGNGTININGSVNAGTGSYCKGVQQSSGSLLLNINGDLTGSSSSSGIAVDLSAQCFLTVNGNLTGIATEGKALRINGTGTFAITGDVIGGATGSGLQITGAAVGTVRGTVTGGTSYGGAAIDLTGSGSVRIIGNCQASIASNAVKSNNGLVYVTGPLSSYLNGMQPLACKYLFWEPGATQMTMTLYEGIDPFSPRSLYSADVLPGIPAIADVKAGVTFGPANELTGTLPIPAAANVTLGIPTGDEIGIAVLTQADIAAVFGPIWAQG